jgi:hypothetical protein
MTIRTRNLAITPSLLFSAALFLASPVAPAFGQRPSPAAGGASAPTPLSGADRAGALQAIKEVLLDSYVLPEMRGKLVERLIQSQAAGRYDVEDSHVFADRITEDLRDLTGDGHLSLRLAPAEYAAAIAPPAGDDGNEAFARRHAVREHHGLTELRVLPGNVRYLRITGFQWVLDETGEAYDDAMRFLKDGDAVIIDLREQALDVAHSLALTRLVRTPGVTPEALTDYAWARTAVEARLHPVSISPKQLQTLAGDYGEVSVAFRDGVLWLARPNRQTRRLSPLKSDGLFAVEGVEILRVRFIRKGLQLLYHGEPAPRLFEKT